LSSSLPPLALGTVQFGLRYGFNPAPAPAGEEVAAILRFAWEEGIDTLDTAPAYGDAELRVAEFMPAQARFRIVTKLPAARGPVDAGAARRSALESAARLGGRPLEALLAHHAPDLLAPGGEALFAAMERLRAEGVVRRLGVSVYDAATLRAVLGAYPLDIVQLPLNVLDQRLLLDGSLALVAGRGVEVHVRSVFLQGVLLAAPAELPPALAALRAPLERFRAAAGRAGLSCAAAALAFVARCAGVARLVVGVNSLAQLRANVGAYAEAARAAPFDASALAANEVPAVDPRSWPA